MGVALEWEPWNWDLWDTALELEDDDVRLEFFRQMLDEAQQAGRKAPRSLPISFPRPIIAQSINKPANRGVPLGRTPLRMSRFPRWED